ncbi:hypothetical protein JOC86_002392 [Bacillus pakistanensis]|uniref:Uncharacterized protein n=1 Tax=Rossellomorea pakistanensis TaxID=992288 RepID=A0ABS2NDG1_9BACI|nr:hypothetical protein [Bacillus pakistanensis]MBM7585850.1 hypothetical protein [Bacillus pakistanensis]
MRKFEFQKAYEEIEIAGNVYRVDFSDAKIKEYQQEFFAFQDDIKKLESVDETKLSEEDQWKHFEELKTLVKKIINTVLGEDSFEPLYKAAGKSVMNMLDLVWHLAEIVNDRKTRNLEDKKSKYVKGKKK